MQESTPEWQGAILASVAMSRTTRLSMMSQNGKRSPFIGLSALTGSVSREYHTYTGGYRVNVMKWFVHKVGSQQAL